MGDINGDGVGDDVLCYVEILVPELMVYLGNLVFGDYLLHRPW